VQDIEDLAVLMFRGPLWQWKGVAGPVGEGRYEWETRLPEPGRYRVLLKSRSHGIAFGDLPAFHVRAEAEPLAEHGTCSMGEDGSGELK
ncbi:MAG: hypothetical protein RL885_23640, partial [Planctomycetota bacterium]